MAKRKGSSRNRWIIEVRSIDPSRDAVVAYKTKVEAVYAAADFVATAAKFELDTFGDDFEAAEDLKELIAMVKSGMLVEAVEGWLEYQSEHDPEEKIAIGPAGSISDQSHDFLAVV